MGGAFSDQLQPAEKSSTEDTETKMATAKGEHKEDLSRMEGTYGAEVIGKLKKMKVFIKGLSGLGAETAKNLILTGPQSVVLQDDAKATSKDMGVNFYLKEDHIKKGLSRGKATIDAFGELNPNVTVKLHEGEIDDNFLSQFNVVAFCDNEKLEDLKKWNAFCRKKGILFLHASVLGMYASVFADYGDKFTVRDQDGEPLRTLIVDDISNSKNGVVTIDGDRHLLSDGDWVKIEEVQGMGPESKEERRFELEDKVTDINQTFVVKGTKNPKQFIIGDTTGLTSYKSGGVISQVKVPKDISHKSFEAQLAAPTFEEGYVDFMKFGREHMLHVCKVAVMKFMQTKGKLPSLHDSKDADEVVKLAKAFAAESKLVEAVDEKIVRQVALFAEAETCAMASLFGGVLAQEITKYSGKYRPINQWLHFDAFELLPADGKVPPDAKPKGTRYDNHVALFGAKFQEKVMTQKLFVVGCGALGCEYMKMVAMTGLGVHGSVSCTDDDRIELSNLSRQFLFRRKHVGKSKSSSSAEAAVEMNPELKKSLKAFEVRVEPKSENTFNDDFWQSLDMVINALDNNIARQYTDSKCVLYEKPLFESGTLGTKANTAICIPHKTPSYSEGVVAGEGQGIAKCTLRNFPSLPLHCIEWAREIFDDLFVSGADNANSLLEDRDGYFKKLQQSPLEERDSLQAAKTWLEYSKDASFDKCCQIMFEEFHRTFRDIIKDLQTNFPADARNTRKTEDGEVIDLGPFWHGAKRFPSAAEYDVKNPLHVDYIYHGANILASIFGIKQQSRQKVIEVTSKLKPKSWKFSGAKVDLDEGKEEAKDKPAEEAAPPTVSDEDSVVIKKLTAELKSLSLDKFKKLTAADFEKDDDDNHHIDFLTAATNLRAFNYQIKSSTRANVRMVAGRIIPAIATTTAMITGFVQLEILKYIMGLKLEDHRAATVNLGTNTFCVELLPDPIKKTSGMDQATYMQVKAVPEGWTVWDKIDIKMPGATMTEFLEGFTAQHHGCTIDLLSTPDGKTLHDFSNSERIEANKDRTVMEIYEELNGGPVFPPGRKYVMLNVAGEDADGDTANMPMIRYWTSRTSSP
eukprot:g78565.t1